MKYLLCCPALQEWLDQTGCGKLLGPMTGPQLLQMLHDEQLEEAGVLIKKSDWVGGWALCPQLQYAACSAAV